MTPEEMKIYLRNYYKTNRTELLKKKRVYESLNKDKSVERTRKNNIKHKNEFYGINLINKVSIYFKRNYDNYISFENYIIISKISDLSLKRSIMGKLTQGIISEQEAVEMSNETITEEDKIYIEKIKSSYKPRN